MEGRRDHGQLSRPFDRAPEFSRGARADRSGFSTRVGPGIPPFILGPKRYFAPALTPKEIPAPDVIVLSHAHFDHFDVWSLRKFPRRTPVVTARATGDLLHCQGFRNVHELDWGNR